ncbi:MAG TPA: nuclear transport factor 2 family protein [Ohtaekwangia sp.]|uniref:nuclear transport factor 2 family protein n=1 Tax=Ohtaekwangia sp. TaxID=2066019 RepID=UPI002F94CC8C
MTEKAYIPSAFTNYVTGVDKKDVAGIAACFTPDAVVQDEGHVYTGREAIRNWVARGFEEYQYTLAVKDIQEKKSEWIATTLVTGTFDGSPIQLRFIFTLKDALMATLTIRS